MSLNQERIFALKLHSLHQEDREWILSQLDSEARSRLAPLLEELNELGFEVDPSTFRALENSKTELDKKARLGSMTFDMASIAKIDSASPSRIEIIFDQEPGIFLQTLTAIYPWQWAADSFSKSSEPSRQHYTPTESAPPSATVRQALVRAVARQLSSQEHIGSTELNDVWSQSYQPVKPSLFQQWRTRFLLWKQ